MNPILRLSKREQADLARGLAVMGGAMRAMAQVMCDEMVSTMARIAVVMRPIAEDLHREIAAAHPANQT